MMGIPPSEAKRLSLRDYQGLIFRWNERHATEDDLIPPDADEVAAMFENLPVGMLN